MTLTDDVLAQIAELRDGLNSMRERAEHQDLSGDGVPPAEVDALRIRFRAALDRLVPAGSTYAHEADAITRSVGPRGWAGFALLKYMNLLEAFQADVERGYVRQLEEQVREAVYDDFLEMATAINDIHAAPAAVVAGSVLEKHVRQLAIANNILVHNADGKARKFEQITHDLVKKPVISESQRKVLAGWYGQRTEGAHGHFDQVIADEVPRMIDGIRDFMTRYPA